MSTNTAGAVTQGPPVLPDQLFAGPDEEPDRWQLHGTGMTGGEGTTWEARYLGRLTAPLPRAVKMLHRPPGAAGDWPAGSDLRRWDDQLAVLRHLDPKRVVRLFSVTTGPPPHPRGQYAATRAGEQPVVYLEMEWLDGPTLDALVRGRPATPGTLPDRLRFVEQAAEAVADLHSRTRTGGNPALHRDLKPGNCIVDTKRGLVLIDVSTLRLSDDGADPLGRHTPGYTAPEVMAEPIRAREARSDVYSLGALAVFCLTGEDPPLPSVRATGRLARQVRAAARAAGVRNATAFAGHLTAAVAAHPERRPVDVQRWARILTTLGGPVETRPRRHHRSAARRILRPAGAAGMTAAALVLAAGAFGLTRIHGAPTSQTTGGETGLVRPSATATSTAAAPSGAPQPRPTSQPAPTTPTPTPTRRPSTAPTGSAGPGAPRPPTGPPAPVRAAGAIAAPADGASVPQCAYFSGTATLPAGDTLILAMQNISNGQADQYVEFVFGWQTPAPRWTWRGAQFFGTGDESVGQRYRVRLMAVALAEAGRLGNSPTLAATGTTLDSVELRRVAGPGPAGCVDS